MSDEALVSASRAGDQDAFRKLVERHAQRVYSFLRRRVSSDEDASDLAQEVFVTVYTSLSRLRNDAGFGGWLLGITRNQWKMYLRRAEKRELPSDELDDEQSPEPDAEEHLRLESLKRLVGDLVGKLTLDQREVVELFYWDGLTYDEISTALDLPKTTVKSRLHEARRSLKGTLHRSLRSAYRAQRVPDRFVEEIISRCGEGCECGLTLNTKGGA